MHNTEWLKIKTAMAYIEIKDKRTFRKLLNDGLRHIVLPNGEIRIKRGWLDEYMTGFEVSANQVDQIINDVMGAC